MPDGRTRPNPTLELELDLIAQTGATIVAGLDEAGRGALAGPVYAAAVVLPLNRASVVEVLARVTDSKLLSPGQRDQLFPLICDQAITFGIGHISAQEIDRVGIVPATVLAMERALDQLDPPAEAALVDGRVRLSRKSLSQQQVIRGDSLSLSIAAASILAKVSRDRHMRYLELAHPGYGFAQHKGYGTAAHMAAIHSYGPCPEHRLSLRSVPYGCERGLTDDPLWAYFRPNWLLSSSSNPGRPISCSS